MMGVVESAAHERLDGSNPNAEGAEHAQWETMFVLEPSEKRVGSEDPGVS